MSLVSGWGQHEFGEWSTVLKFTYVPIYPYNECEGLYCSITKNMTCSFNSSDGDVGTGDTGGPLIVSGIKVDAKKEKKIDKYSLK